MRSSFLSTKALDRTSMAVLLVMLFALFFRTLFLDQNEFRFDIFGYYLYLPAMFVHGDPLLNDVTWVREALVKYDASGSLYQISSAPDGSPIYFFLMGQAILYLPFFLLAHAIALLTGYTADGFSQPYQVVLAYGMLVYVFGGLLVLKKILTRWFTDRERAWVILLIGLGTNYLHFMSAKDLETASTLFFMMTLLVWNTIRWHERSSGRPLLWVGFSVGMIALIKPSEVVCVLIPMLWGLFEKNGPMLKIALIRESWKDIFGALLIALLVFTPQMTYWYMKTGTVLYDSYINPGVGLDFTTPHVIPLLFSFRKGWLVYTPIMLFALTGFLLMRKDRSAQLPVILIYFFSTLYIISSWSEWWYGSSFSIRPLITSYVLLAIPLGHTVRWISGCKAHLRGILVGVLVLLVCLNLFQTWQHNAGILRGYRMTAPFYFAVFGRTKVPKEAWKLLSIERSFDGNDRLVDTTGYDRVPLFNESFDDRTNDDVDAIWSKGARGGVLQLDSAAPFSPEYAVPYVELSKTEHVWIRARFRVFIPTDHPGGTPCLAIMLSRDEGNYAYRTRCSDDIERGVWQDVEMDYLTPHIRDVRDKLKVHVWHRGRHPVWIDDLHLEVWVPRNERR